MEKNTSFYKMKTVIPKKIRLTYDSQEYLNFKYLETVESRRNYLLADKAVLHEKIPQFRIHQMQILSSVAAGFAAAWEWLEVTTHG